MNPSSMTANAPLGWAFADQEPGAANDGFVGRRTQLVVEDCKDREVVGPRRQGRDRVPIRRVGGHDDRERRSA